MAAALTLGDARRARAPDAGARLSDRGPARGRAELHLRRPRGPRGADDRCATRARGAARRGRLLAAPELVRGRRARGRDRLDRRRLEPDHRHLPRARDELRLPPGARAVRAAAPDLEHVLTVRAEPGPGMRALEALERAPTAPTTPHGPHDVSMLFYTSGTTADPKGVLHTPSTLGAVIRFQAELLHPSPDDRRLLHFPLSHLGCTVMCAMRSSSHGQITVSMESFDHEL